MSTKVLLLPLWAGFVVASNDSRSLAWFAHDGPTTPPLPPPSKKQRVLGRKRGRGNRKTAASAQEQHPRWHSVAERCKNFSQLLQADAARGGAYVSGIFISIGGHIGGQARGLNRHLGHAVRHRQAGALRALTSMQDDARRILPVDGGASHSQIDAENQRSLRLVLEVIESQGWEHVTVSQGVTVTKKFMGAPPGTAGETGDQVVDAAAAAKFACVRASGTLNARCEDVYKLFLDNERVQEYNDNCKQVKDLQFYGKDTKVTWACTSRFGPFKARDFVTVVHYRTLADGSMVVVNRPVDHPKGPKTSKYVRAEILIATNMMRPHPGDPSRTDFISVTHINPGGIVDSPVGAQIANALCSQAPVKLLKSLERAANTRPRRT